MKRSLLFGLVLGRFLMGTETALAQWTSQKISLRPGWNAVFVEVQPEPREIATVMAGLPVESVWLWNRRYSSIQFLTAPDNLLPQNPDWLSCFPANPPISGQSGLYTILGGRSYLIKLAANAAAVTWEVHGKPVVRPTEWVANSLNFVGFSVATNPVPTFQQFFQSSPAHQNNLRFRLDSQGRWQPIAASAQMARGEALWIRTDGASDFSGPLQVTPALGTRIDFGRAGLEQKVVIRNRAAESRTISVRQLPSETPPAAGGFPTLAGPVPLDYWSDQTRATYGWFNFPAELSFVLAPGETKTLRLAVRRPDMAAVPAGNDPTEYQSLLEVRDSVSLRSLIPIIASGLQGSATRSARAQLAAGAAPDVRAGLWVGSAVINQVSQPAHPTDPSTPRAASSEAEFRMIIHVRDDGQASLLQHVTLMWKDGTKNAAGVVVEPGRQVLVTDDSVIEKLGLTGSTLQGGEVVGRRISTACFAFDAPQPMTPAGAFGDLAKPLGCRVSLDYNHPLNPFKHRFHPDHNNLSEDYRTVLPEGDESYTFSRELRLTFTAKDPSDLSLPGWGDNQLGGIYEETVRGVHKDPITIRGSFRLHQASRISVLNDGL